MNYTTLGTGGFSCAVCGKPLKPDDEVAVCPDCGAVICRDCAENGGLEDHDCDPDGDMEY